MTIRCDTQTNKYSRDWPGIIFLVFLFDSDLGRAMRRAATGDRPYNPVWGGLCPDPVPGMPGGGQHGL